MKELSQPDVIAYVHVVMPSALDDRIMSIDIIKKIMILWLIILLLQPIGVCLAQTLPESISPFAPTLEDIGIDDGKSQFNEEVVDVLHSGSGFAFVDNGSHPFWLSVVSARAIEPKSMRTMLTSNSSLDEIRAALDETEGQTRFDGAIKLDESIYPLANIWVQQTKDNSSVLDADVIDPGMSRDEGYEKTKIGRIALIIFGSGRGLSAEGELILSRGPQAAKYRIILDLQPHQ